MILSINKILEEYPDLVETKQYFNHMGDPYGSFLLEETYEYNIKLGCDTLTIQYIKITENEEDWAQSESYETQQCYFNAKSISIDETKQILNNIKEYVRDSKIKKILKNES
jgi:hypothetical protein